MRDIPVFHREQEMAAVAEELARAQQGQPAVLVIAGGHGMGKTTLLQAALDQVRATAVILHARCHEAERDFPFGVVRQLFDTMTSVAENGPAGSLTAGFAGPGGGGQEQDLHSLYQATRSLASSKSVIIAVDDFNYADAASAKWFSYIARRLDGLPVSLILAGDTDYPGGAQIADELRPLPYFRAVNPRPLCGKCGESLVATIFSRPVDIEFAAACHQLACGNPLVLLELCRRLRGAGVAPEKARLDQVAEIGATTLWETVSPGLRLRQRSTVELIECLAILGAGASLETAAILAGHGELAIEGARELLGRAGLLAGQPPSRFAHPHLAAAIVARMDPERRCELHSEAAALLARLGAPPADVAAHVMSISPSGTLGNVQVLRAAAREAATEKNWPEAARFLRRALAETTEPDLLAAISGDLGAVETHRDVPSSLRYMRAVVGQTRAPRDAAAALVPFTSLGLTLNSAAAGQAFASAYGQLITAGPDTADRLALLRLGTQAMLSGHRTEIRPALALLAGRAPAPLRRQATPVEAAAEDLRCALAIATAARGKARRRVAGWAGHCGDVGEAPDRHAGGWLPTPGCALVLTWAGLFNEASALADRHVELAQSRRSTAELALTRVVAAEVAYRRGDLGASLAAGQAAMDDATAVGAYGLRVAAAALSARVLIERGEADAAAGLLADSDPSSGVHHLITGFHRYVRARHELASGRLREGLALLMDAGRLLSAHGITNPACVGWRSRAVLTHVRLGQGVLARKLAAEDIAAARAWGAPVTIGRALTAASAAHPPAEALGMLCDAVAILDGTGALLEQARAHVRLGTALNSAGRDRDAREALHRGLDLATSCGAVQLAARARDRLLAAGARQREATGFQPTPLTAGERRVTELVVQGLTNQEVAIKLCISKRTVDTHLAHVYRKLGIRSRSRLREAVHSMAGNGIAVRGEPRPVAAEMAMRI
ncbi:MAG TPA: AAA family ATPase [Streptosporangiaceae bacterium]